MIAVFVFVQGVMPGAFWPHFVMAVVLVGLTPLYLFFAQGVRTRAQLVLSTLSLVVWIYAMGTGPLRFVHPPYYEPWHGAVVLAVWTLVPPMLLTQKPVPDLARSSARPARTTAKKSTSRKTAARKR